MGIIVFFGRKREFTAVNHVIAINEYHFRDNISIFPQRNTTGDGSCRIYRSYEYDIGGLDRLQIRANILNSLLECVNVNF